jgi:hydrogenase maturation protease
MRIIVLGVGNTLLRDEGIGSYIVQLLEGYPLPSNVELMDGGTSPDVFCFLCGADKLIAVDAVMRGGDPGTIYRFHPDDILCESRVPISVHDVGLLKSLGLMEFWGCGIGEVVIIGVEPKEIGWGLGLSSVLQQRVPQIVEAVLAEFSNGHKS